MRVELEGERYRKERNERGKNEERKDIQLRNVIRAKSLAIVTFDRQQYACLGHLGQIENLLFV